MLKEGDSLKQTNLKKNFLYNLIYQVLIIIVPFLITPYVSRVIGVNGVGIYSYTYSIAHYFMLLTLLGVNNYGNRTIAKVRDDKENLSKTFWSIYVFQLIMGIFMILLYLLYVLLFDVNYKVIALIQIIFVISSMLDINWFFFGIEDFKSTVIRNTVMKISNMLLIFIFVKSSSDLIKYTLIMSIMTLVSQLIMWNLIKNKIVFVKPKIKDIILHIKPNLTLFIPVIAISLYKTMDKIMLGLMTNINEVGYYESAEKVINIPITIISALGTVMLPRISNLVAKKDTKIINEYLEKSMSFIMFMSFPICLGLITIGEKFSIIYFGMPFLKAGTLIKLLSLTLPIVSFANILRTQYIIPNEKDKIYIGSVALGAIINLIINIILIPKLESIGACIGTIMAEFSVMFYQIMAVKNNLTIKKYIKNIIPFALKSIIMFVVIYLLNFLKCNNFIILILQIFIGVTCYFFLNFKYIDSIICFKTKLLKIIKNRSNYEKV